MEKVVSKDGTPIAYERTGKGPALILVDGAMCSRAFGPMPTLAPLFAEHFTVFVYDRRGRGDSGDTAPYASEREVEDIDALVRAAGGSACVLGLSSGGALALQAAATTSGIRKVAAYEPPYIATEGAPAAHHEERLKELVTAGRRGAAVQYFMRDMVGVPLVFVVLMRATWWVWRKLERIAHTLPYDAAVMGDFAVPTARLARIAVPSLVAWGGKTDPRLAQGARAATNAIPGARGETLAGQTHNVKPDVLAPVVIDFFRT